MLGNQLQAVTFWSPKCRWSLMGPKRSVTLKTLKKHEKTTAFRTFLVKSPMDFGMEYFITNNLFDHGESPDESSRKLREFTKNKIQLGRCGPSRISAALTCFFSDVVPRQSSIHFGCLLRLPGLFFVFFFLPEILRSFENLSSDPKNIWLETRNIAWQKKNTIHVYQVMTKQRDQTTHPQTLEARIHRKLTIPKRGTFSQNCQVYIYIYTWIFT